MLAINGCTRSESTMQGKTTATDLAGLTALTVVGIAFRYDVIMKSQKVVSCIQRGALHIVHSRLTLHCS